MKLKLRLTALMLALITAFSFSACSDGEDDKNTPTAGTTAPAAVDTDPDAETTMADARANVSDNLPANKYNGKTLKLLIRDENKDNFYCEEPSDDSVEDMLYRRDSNITARFDVKLEYNFIPGSWNDQGTYMAFVRSAIGADDDSIMIGDGYAAYITGLAGEKLVYDLTQLEYINMDAPWWFNQLTDEMTIGGKCYFISGDISVGAWSLIQTMIFNKQLAENYGMNDIYDVVKQGKWTLDKLAEYSKGIYTDLNSNGTADLGDNFGFVTTMSANIDAMQLTLNSPITTKDSDGYPVLNLDNEIFVNMAEKLYSILYETEGILCTPEGVSYNSNFQSNEIVLMTQALGGLSGLRSMEVDFGIIPYPKYDDNQENYMSVMTDGFSLYYIPANIGDDAEFTSIMLEALCAESYRIVIPEYYEKALKTKGTRDNESEAMIDLIRDCLTFNFGYINSVPLAGGAGIGPAQILRVTLREGSANIVSKWNANKKGTEKKLEKLLEIYYE